MADELKVVVSMQFSKGGAKAQRAESISVDVTGEAFTHDIQSIDTSVEVLVTGDALSTMGYIFIKNLDDTDYVTLGLSGQYSIKLQAGEIALFRAAADIYALANNSACLVEYWIVEA